MGSDREKCGEAGEKGYGGRVRGEGFQGAGRGALRGVSCARGGEERVELVFPKITVRCQAECRLAQHPHLTGRHAATATGVTQSGELEGREGRVQGPHAPTCPPALHPGAPARGGRPVRVYRARLGTRSLFSH